MSKVLCILDGFGLLPDSENNCISMAKMPNFRRLLKDYWWTTLNADGEEVGQETGLVGNSEVGHMNIGGLKLVPQLSYQITKSSENSFDLKKELSPDQLFDPKKLLQKTFNQPEKSKIVHLVGLFSKGKIHSDLRHWAGAIQVAGKSGAEKIVLHIISDGRDSDRKSLVETWEYFIKTFETKLKPFENKVFLGSLGGRFYSMDRDNNWDRVARGIMPMISYKAIDASDQCDNKPLLKFFKEKYEVDLKKILDEESQKWDIHDKAEDGGPGPNYFFESTHEHQFFNSQDRQNREELGPLKTDIEWMLKYYTEKWYEKEIYDEFLPPTTFYYLPIGQETRPFEQIMPTDTVWLLNFRTDRMKQFGKMLTEINREFDLNLTILSMNDYCFNSELYLDENLEIKRQKTESGYYPVFKNQPVQETLAQRISEQNKTQLHIAETEKYNHVTYFFNGGQDKKWPGEDWSVIPSNKVASHAEKPEMKALEVTDYILDNGLSKYDYIIVNYANPDMVGHTGDIEAGIKSMEFLDLQLGKLVEKIESEGHQMVIIADHGNIEFVGDYKQGGKAVTDTEHNASSVPCIIVSRNFDKKILLENFAKIKSEMSPAMNLDLCKKVLDQENQLDLSQSWLNSNDIPEPRWSLWMAGVILMGL